MRESLVQSFALIGLNGQMSNHRSITKTVTMRTMSIAVVLELYLNGLFDKVGDRLKLKREILVKYDLENYQEVVLSALLNKKEELSYTLEEWLKAAASIKAKVKKELEKTLYESFSKQGLIEKVPSLLGCDLFYDSSGVSLEEYRSYEKAYVKEISRIKMELLEEGELTDEAIVIFWLLRESAALVEVFSGEELETLKKQFNAYSFANPESLINRLLPIRVHITLQIGIKNYLKMKKNIMQSKKGVGISFICPPIERAESVFIETEQGFSNQIQRLEDLSNRLSNKGHHFTILREGKVPIVKIDNIIYYAIPTAIVVSRVPIHGIRLRRRVL